MSATAKPAPAKPAQAPAPIAAPAKAKAPADDDITSFIPDYINPDAPDEVTPPEPDVRQVEKPVEKPVEPTGDKKEADFDFDKPVDIRKPAQKPGANDKPAGNKMREELERISAEHKKSVADLEEQRTAFSTERKRSEELERRLKELEAQLSPPVMDKNSPEIVSIAAPWNERSSQFAVKMEDAGIEDGNVQEMLMEMSKRLFAADPSSPEHQEKISQMRNDLGRALGKEHVPEAMELVRSGASVIAKIRNTMEEAAKNAPKIMAGRNRASYLRRREEVNKIMDKAFNPDQQTVDADPMHVSVLLRQMIADNEDAKAAAEKAKEFTRFVMLPPPVPEDADFDDPEAAGDLIAKTTARHKELVDSLARLLPEALMARSVLPAVMKQLADLTSSEKSHRRSSRMKLDGEPDRNDDDALNASDDIRTFEPEKFDPDEEESR